MPTTGRTGGVVAQRLQQSSCVVCLLSGRLISADSEQAHWSSDIGIHRRDRGIPRPGFGVLWCVAPLQAGEATCLFGDRRASIVREMACRGHTPSQRRGNVRPASMRLLGLLQHIPDSGTSPCPSCWLRTVDAGGVIRIDPVCDTVISCASQSAPSDVSHPASAYSLFECGQRVDGGYHWRHGLERVFARIFHSEIAYLSQFQQAASRTARNRP